MPLFLKKDHITIIRYGLAVALLLLLPKGTAALDAVSTGSSLGKGILREPLGLAAGPSGGLFVADAMAGKVFMFGPDGQHVEFEAPSRGESIYPIDLAVNGPFIYVLDYNANRLLRFDAKGAFLDVLISFSGMDRMAPVSITGAGGGRFVSTDIKNHGLAVWSPLLDLEFSWNDYGWGDGALDRPMKGAMAPDERIIVCDTGNSRVQVFSPSGKFESVLELPEGEEFKSPRAVCPDSRGNIFIADSDGGKVHIFNQGLVWEGSIERFDGKDILPSSVAAGWGDELYVADLRTRTILVYRLEYGEDR